MKASIRPLRPALTREHARRILLPALERKDARGVREAPGEILAGEETRELAPVPGARERDLRNARARERLGLVLDLDGAVAHDIAVVARPVVRPGLGPAAELARPGRDRSPPPPPHSPGRGRDEGRRRFLARRPGRARRLGRCRRSGGFDGSGCEGREGALGPGVRAGEDPRVGIREGRVLGGSLRPRMIVAHALGDLRQVALPPAREHGRGRMQADRCALRLPGPKMRRQPETGEARLERLGEALGSRIVPGPRHRRKDRHLLVGERQLAPIAPPLLAHVAQGVGRPLAIAFVQHDQVGEVEHVDLLELRRCTVVGRHHVERAVDPIDDLGIALADARRLEQDEIEARRAQHGEGVADRRREREMGAPRRHRADEDLRPPDRVHADPIAEERPAAAPPRGIDEQERDPERRRVPAQAQDDLVDDARLAGAAGPREPDDRGPSRRARRRAPRGAPPPRPCSVSAWSSKKRISRAISSGRSGESCDASASEALRRVDVPGTARGEAFLDDRLDHPVEAQGPPVLGAEDPRDAAALEGLDLLGRDRPAAAAVDPHVGHAGLREPAHEVPEELHVPALVGRDGDGVGGFLDGRLDELVDAAVVAEVDHLGALRLQQPAHDVDRGVVAVEEGRGRDDANRCLGAPRARLRGLPHARFLFAERGADGRPRGSRCARDSGRARRAARRAPRSGRRDPSRGARADPRAARASPPSSRRSRRPRSAPGSRRGRVRGPSGGG